MAVQLVIKIFLNGSNNPDSDIDENTLHDMMRYKGYLLNI